jgi:signal transduction histidine kinase/NO-binding membrane sensor protein with MHYT domain/AmiR/NasT family two-component response regulator
LIIGGHDVLYLVAAVSVCVLSSFALRWLHSRTEHERGLSGGLWLWFRALAGGSGVWAANVLACLGYRPGFSWTLNPWVVAGALLTAVSASALSLIAVRKQWIRSSPLAGTVVVASAFALSHFVTIAGVQSSAELHWSASWQVAGVLVMASLVFASSVLRTRTPIFAVSAISVTFNVAAIASLHLMSFAGLTAKPAGVEVMVPGPVYGVVIAVVSLALQSVGACALVMSAFGEQKALLRLRAATNAMPSALALFDVEDRLVSWNKVFELVMGPKADQVREGMPLAVLSGVMPAAAEHLHPELSARVPRERRHAEILAGDRWIRVDHIPTEDGGLLSLGNDITDIRRAQDALAEALDRAEAGSRAKSEFLATMSHEIRTPLNGVLGMAHALGAEPLTPAQREKLEVIQRGGEALLSVLNNVLDLSKIEAGRVALEDGVADIERITHAVQAIFSAIAHEKDIALSVTVSPEAAGLWRGDPMRIQQILQNLVSNAVKFTERGRVAIEAGVADGALLLRVSDTGPGVALEVQAQVFDAFTQADASTTRRFGGSGLGLSICRALAQLMGGDIGLESVVGLGSTFTVRLPLERAAAEAGPAAQSPRATLTPLAGLRLLAAEDNEMNQLVLRTLLEPFGVVPHIVGNGEEAVEAWETGDWRVILMDMQMPVMDGVTATRLIREREAERGLPPTPIIALTANAMSHHAEEYLACGMDEVVAKPLNITELIHTIERVRQKAEDAALLAPAPRRQPPETAPRARL